MERNYSKTRLSAYLLSLSVFVFASSCTIYQNVPDDDGIYSSEKKEPRVIVENSDEHRDYENNYFTKELERIDDINGTDILIDIESYSSVNDSIPSDLDSISNYNTGRAWGFDDNDEVVININLNGSGNYYNPWFSGPYWGYGGYPWLSRPITRGYSRYYFDRFGPYSNPYCSPFDFYYPYYNGFVGYRPNRWGYYGYGGLAYNNSRNYRYGRRNTSLSNYRRNLASNRRSSSSTTRRSSTVSRRNTSNTTRRNSSSTVRRNSNSNTRRPNSSNTVRRRATNTRSSRPTIRRSSSSSTRRSSSSTRRSSSSMRRSSSSSTRSRSSGSSSTRRSSGSSRSSSKRKG